MNFEFTGIGNVLLVWTVIVAAVWLFYGLVLVIHWLLCVLYDVIATVFRHFRHYRGPERRRKGGHRK